jgi:hypothetical protein
MCEGDGCSSWQFTSGEATGTWSDGAVGTLSIVQFPSSSSGSVTIHRVDNTGVGKGIDGTYSGTRHGSIIEGEISWKWPGHPDGHGDWFAVIMVDGLHIAPDAGGNPAQIPAGFTECDDGLGCHPWVLNGRIGKIPGLANLTVERFDDSVVAIRRNETAGALTGMEALYIGIRKGSEIHGVAVWKWSGNPPTGVIGWHATLPQTAPQPEVAKSSEYDRPAPVPPPQTMHLCSDVCETLTLAGDHYNAVRDDDPKITDHYTIASWKREVELDRTPKSDDGSRVYFKFLGDIADSGDHLTTAVAFGALGITRQFRATWGAARSAPDLPPPHRSKTHPNLLLPSGASEIYASYDDHLRAELMSIHMLGQIDTYDAARPCRETPAITSPDVSQEIARFAYRAGQIERGNCWAERAVQLGSAEGEMLVALGWIEGWHGKKDVARGCKAMEAIGTRSNWAMIALRDCYHDSTDPGFPPDPAKEQKLNEWLNQRATLELSEIGSDDMVVMKQRERQALIDYPPTMTITTSHYCQYSPGGSCPRTGYTSSPETVVDQHELAKRLRQIDERYDSMQ